MNKRNGLVKFRVLKQVVIEANKVKGTKYNNSTKLLKFFKGRFYSSLAKYLDSLKEYTYLTDEEPISKAKLIVTPKAYALLKSKTTVFTKQKFK